MFICNYIEVSGWSTFLYNNNNNNYNNNNNNNNNNNVKNMI